MRINKGTSKTGGSVRCCLAVSIVISCLGATVLPQTPIPTYRVYVVGESSDKIALIRFGKEGARVEKEFETGLMPTDVDGPHGVVVSRDKKFYYVSLGHGRPFGSVLKYSTDDDKLLGHVRLGPFPATMDLTPDGSFLYVVNFNLHGDMVRSSVSVVATEAMIEVRRIPTCTMPHGSRINPQGTRHYSACMMDDFLVEIDTSTFSVSRHLLLTAGKEKAMQGSPAITSGRERSSHAGHGSEPPKPVNNSCSPTWVQPSRDGTKVFVACNASNEIVEVDAEKLIVTRRLKAQDGVYNLATTLNGHLISTNKRAQSVSIFDVASGKELSTIPTKRKVLHGVAVSPDDRFAFVSVEGVGSEPGSVEIIDLKSLKSVAAVDVPAQAAGIDFFRIDQK